MFDPKTRVLIIDDMMTMRKIVGKVCRELGFSDLTEAADGALGWQAISTAEQPFGIVISDWNMPNCTGLDLLKRVRGDKRFAHLPFLLVTAEAEKHQIVEALQTGVSAYIIKPFTPDTLKQKLEEAHQKFATSLKAG
jgi:two-component system chemotaxis response regulator CheY